MPVSSQNEPEAPHGLGLVIDFVNTWEAETDIDEIASPQALAVWLAGRGLLDPGISIREPHRERAVRLREALRVLMMRHNGLQSGVDAAAELEAVARRGRLSVRFGFDGSSRLGPDAAGFDGALAQLLIPVIESGSDGSWERVKACRADDCLWAFYDHSRNRAGVWCDMAGCGNRAKVRAYRSRKPR
jgi:predicted RNA-binding Zn ribbon-like protein